MPPRLNKRQLRELQELEQLERASAASRTGSGRVEPLPEFDQVQDDEHESESDGAEVDSGSVRQTTTGFGALDIGQGDPDDDDDGEIDPVETKGKKKSKNKKKKKKKAPLDAPAAADDADHAQVETDSVAEVQSPTPTGPKKNKKKAKAKKPEPRSEPKADDGLDEIDRALAELAAKNGGAAEENETAAQANSKIDPKANAVKELFAFDTKYLDSDAELRRMFGSKVIGTAPTAPRSRLHARFANNPHHSTSIRRTSSYLTTPEPGWPPASGTLALARYEGPESAVEPTGDWHTIVHPPSYKQAQLMFLEVLQQADGNRLFDVLAAQPYHVDTLMQLSEMMAQQGDLGASATHLSRALYALSTPLPTTFPTGSFRLAYSQMENRAFFLSIARQVAILHKRGTWRTAFEFAKIALGTGGGDDPVGMLCWIDFLAPKANQNEWFLKLVPALDTSYPEMRAACYPGLAFAKALVLRNLEEEKKEGNEKSTEALKSAILKFPVVATLLSTSLAFDLPPSLVTLPRAQPSGAFTTSPSYLTSLLAELYVVRSGPLWKDPASLAWLRKCCNEVAGEVQNREREEVREGEKIWNEGAWDKGVAPAGVIRAAFISEAASVRPYLPPSTRSGATYSFDPCPPDVAHATFYDDAYFASLYQASNGRRRRGGGVGARGRPGGPAGGPGGNGNVAAALRDGLARMLGMGDGAGAVDLTPELRDELMRELEMLNGGGMPGGFEEGEDEDEDDDDYEDEDEDDDQDAAGDDAQGTEEARREDTRNLLGRLGALFGQGAPRPE
ncbi:hypothetical protein JCM10212_006097 [Sporobolomyces blumeae]